MTHISKKKYEDYPDFPCLLRARVGWPHRPLEYPEGSVGIEMDRMHRANRFINQYGAVFVGGDHIARFRVHDFLGARRQTMPVYVRGIEGLTLRQMYEYYPIFSQEVAPSVMFVSIGLEELKRPEFDANSFAKDVMDALIRFMPNCETLENVFLMALFPVCPKMATDETREALKYLTNERIREANEALARLPDIEGRPLCTALLHFADLNAPITAPNGEMREYLCDDGIHLTADGYFRIFEQLQDVISESLGPLGTPEPEDQFLIMCSRMQALKDYILEHGLLSEEKLASIEDAIGLREISTNEKLDAMKHFLPEADLRELAKYIVHYAEDPTDVLRKYAPEELDRRQSTILEFPTGGENE